MHGFGMSLSEPVCFLKSTAFRTGIVSLQKSEQSLILVHNIDTAMFVNCYSSGQGNCLYLCTCFQMKALIVLSNAVRIASRGSLWLLYSIACTSLFGPLQAKATSSEL